MTSGMPAGGIMRRHLLAIEKLRERVRQVLQCAINLHIEILVLDSNVSQLLDEVRDLNADLLEVQRLDTLIATLRDYSGPTVCHEWPFPLIFKGTIDDADVAAQILNTKLGQQRGQRPNGTQGDTSGKADDVITTT